MPVDRSPGPREDRVSLFARLEALLCIPVFLPITVAVLFVGAGDAVGGPYLTLFAFDQGRMDPLGALIISRFDFRGLSLTFALCAGLAIISLASVRVPAAS